MKFIISIIVLFFNYTTFSQTTNTIKLKKIIANGLCEENSTRCIKKKIQYLDACKDLGDFYFYNKKYQTALKYFLLGLIDYNHNEDEEINKLRNDLAAKSAMMYFNGTGTKKDLKTAFSLHYISPNLNNKTLRNKYSKLYFGDTAEYYMSKINPSFMDSVLNFGINPFYIRENSTSKKLYQSLESLLKELEIDSSLYCELTLTLGLLPGTENSFNSLDRLMTALKKRTNHLNQKIKSQISFDLIGDGNSYLYREFMLPLLSVTLRQR